MPHLNLYTHFVWATHNRQPLLLTKEIRKKMWIHIKENSVKKGIFIDTINGYHDHCHCLVSMSSNQSVDTVAKLLKGESSHWANQQKLIQSKFKWQSDYFAASVSPSMVEKTRNYIKNQEEHHRKVSFKEEYQAFLKANGLGSLG